MQKLIVVLTLMISLLGCSKVYYRTVDGVNASIAVSIPDEDIFKVQLVEYISGSKTTIKEPSSINHKYKSSSTNDYLWGLIRINENRENEIYIIPTTNNFINLKDEMK